MLRNINVIEKRGAGPLRAVVKPTKTQDLTTPLTCDYYQDRFSLSILLDIFNLCVVVIIQSIFCIEFV